LQDTDILLAQLETPLSTIEKVFRIAKEKGIYTVLNPAPAKALEAHLCETIDLLVPNETEFFTLTGYDTETKENIRKGADILLSKGIKALIITLGEKGSVYVTRDKQISYNSIKVKAVDTTAAGDSFIGGLLLKISQGNTIEESIPFASRVAALTVTRAGAQISLPSLEEVELFVGGVSL
jgi:ribokinase